MRKYGFTRAFSLVELVIVIVIIGIIAAIAVPRISRSAAGATEAALMANLSSLRNAIDKYAAEHNGVFPGAKGDGSGGADNSAAAFISQLTKLSKANGHTSSTPSAAYKFGPYLHFLPRLPVGANATSRDVVIDTTNSPPLVQANAAGWVYNPSTGEIIANSDDADADGLHTYDEY